MKTIQRPEVPAPRLPDYSSHQMSRCIQKKVNEGKGGRNSIFVFTANFSIDHVFFDAKTKKEDTKHSSPGGWGKQYD